MIGAQWVFVKWMKEYMTPLFKHHLWLLKAFRIFYKLFHLALQYWPPISISILFLIFRSIIWSDKNRQRYEWPAFWLVIVIYKVCSSEGWLRICWIVLPGWLHFFLCEFARAWLKIITVFFSLVKCLWIPVLCVLVLKTNLKLYGSIKKRYSRALLCKM